MLFRSVTESGLPAEQVSVWAELTRPDGSTDRIDLAPSHDRDEGSFTAAAVGTHRIRVRARGRTRRGNPFTRERLLAASVWLGGDHDAATWTQHDDPQAGSDLCRVLDCLLGKDGAAHGRMDEALERLGLDPRRLRTCLERRCSEDRSPREDP